MAMIRYVVPPEQQSNILYRIAIDVALLFRRCEMFIEPMILKLDLIL